MTLTKKQQKKNALWKQDRGFYLNKPILCEKFTRWTLKIILKKQQKKKKKKKNTKKKHVNIFHENMSKFQT